ncbi:septum formation initiator [Actinomyces sp. Chiba101]|uniref:FtsB family cell division protein n=1 Tax=Actinomyces TaxID=1654 RepID=UPI000974DC06|nr:MULTISPECIES: septum formation initiator family protein [Actinomyces]BAW93969.1 septum formation initiator [Actinomyces sp. Chiba101]SUU74469.1 Septum formation initiator [Actinomyces denticolens]
MSPRRPTPARPRARSEARPTPRTTARSTGPGRLIETGDSIRPRRAERTERTDRDEPPSAGSEHGAAQAPAVQPAPTPMVLRLGGPEGLALPVRLLVLAAVLILALVVVLPTLNNYLAQRARYDAVTQQIDAARATATALEQEAARWQDETYVRSQARERLSYVMPGETSYVVVGADEAQAQAQADAEAAAKEQTRAPWYDALTESAIVAGGASPAPTHTAAPSASPSATPAAPATPEATR